MGNYVAQKSQTKFVWYSGSRFKEWVRKKVKRRFKAFLEQKVQELKLVKRSKELMKDLEMISKVDISNFPFLLILSLSY